MAIKRLAYMKHLDLFLGVAIACLNIFWIWRHGRSVAVGIVLALPLVFWLPGYTLTKVLFFRGRLEAVQVIILSIGVSIAIDILSGFILNMTPWGIGAASWAICLSGLTIGLSLIALFLQRKQVETPARDYWFLRARIEFRKHKLKNGVIALGLFIALGIVVYSLQFSVTSATRQKRVAFTQLWTVQTQQPKNSCSISVGINSFEFTPVTFQIIALANGSHINTWSQTLQPFKVWSTTISLASHAPGDENIEVLLYRTDKPDTIYRNTHLLVHILPAGKHATGNVCTT